MSGFTFIEVILAMLMSAFIAAMAYSGLSTAITASQHSETQSQQLADIQLTVAILERDIRQIVLRSIRDEYGEAQPALQAGSLGATILQLTRGGWHNPLQKARGEIQRVRYVLKERGTLWRDNWLVLDRVSEEEGLQSVLLLKGVKSLRMEFLHAQNIQASKSPLGGTWQQDWQAEPGALERLPLAIRFTLDIENFGQVSRVVQIAS